MKKILLTLVFCLLTTSAFAVDTDIYVNTDTGNDTTGTGTILLPYATLSKAESLNLDLTTGATDGNCTIHCSGATDDTTAVTIAGWTKDVGGQLYIVGDNTTGKWDTSKYLLLCSGTQLTISDPYVHISNLQLAFSGNSDSPHIATSGAVTYIYINNNIIKGINSTSWKDTGIYMLNADGSIYIWNNIIYACAGYNSSSGGIYINSQHANDTYFLYNNTIYGVAGSGSVGIRNAYGDVTAKNNICVNNGGNDYYDSSFNVANSSSNVSGDATSPNSAFRSKTITFVDGTNADLTIRDYHLASTETDAINAGTDVYSNASLAVTTDIDNDTLTVRDDIGADEYVAPAAGGSPPFFSIINVE
jgi:hypothetical protein